MTPGYYTHSPGWPLQDYVDHFWILHEFPAAEKEMIVPDGGVELILNCGIPQRLYDRFDTRRFDVFRDCWVSGLRRSPIVVGTPGPMSIIGVRFKLFGGYRFLGVPMHEITDQVIDATGILGNSIMRLRDRIACAPTPAERFSLFEDYLVRSMGEPTRDEPLLNHVVQRISQEHFAGRIAGVEQELGVSDKQVRRLFRDYIGLSPKSVYRICRFQRTLTHLEGAATIDWALIAARFGYFDQSHMIKEFNTLTDSSPAEYLSRRGPYLNYLATT